MSRIHYILRSRDAAYHVSTRDFYACIVVICLAIFQPAFGQSVKSDSINPYGKGTIIDANGNILKAEQSGGEFYTIYPSLNVRQLMVDVTDEKDAAGMLKSMEWIINQLENFHKKD